MAKDKDKAPLPAEDAKTSAAETESAAEKNQARVRARNMACAGCAGLAVLVLVIGVISVLVWDGRDSRMRKGKPMPTNAAYIGRWATDDTLAVQLSTFTTTGDKMACDFAVRNVSRESITITAIGKTLIAASMDTVLLSESVPLVIAEGDEPMGVTDDRNALWYIPAQGQPLLLKPQDPEAQQPEPISLKPGQVETVKFRPHALNAQDLVSVLGIGALMGGLPQMTGLRLAVQLDDGKEPHPFYFVGESAGIGGWMERGVARGVEKASERR